MYKMIILDLDGTLLNDYKEVSKENVDLIQRAYNEKGIISVIATGRPLGYANEICNLYGNCFANYIIACNGAIIKNSENNEYIHKVAFTLFFSLHNRIPIDGLSSFDFNISSTADK